MTTWTIRRERIPETAGAGFLGRHIRHDSRSLAYPYQVPDGLVIATVLHERFEPITDQGASGSCTGQAMDGALSTEPLFEALPAGTALGLGEALHLYSDAEVIDGDGPYPAQDNGSSGLSVARAAKNAGLISGYTHCFSRDQMLAALQAGPVIVGMSWYEAMDSPTDGLVVVGGSVRGGHEVVSRELDMERGLVWFDNSWGEGWGLGGRFCMSFLTLDRLLSEGGDVTVPLPLTVPAPVPAPVTDPDAQFGTDPEMAAWAVRGHSGLNAYAARQYRAWQHAKGYA